MTTPLSKICLLAVVSCLFACTRATFSSIPGLDAGTKSPDLAGGSPDLAPANADACALPVSRCVGDAASVDPCDPVCQAGSCDWCTQKCTEDINGHPVCGAYDKANSQGTYAQCTVQHAGSPTQSDNCDPGNIALMPDPGSGIYYCFALCRSNMDCPGGVACAPQLLSSSGASQVEVDVCDPSYDSCNPGATTPCCNPVDSTGCPIGRYCYLVAPDASGDSRTACEYTQGTTTRTGNCSSVYDCAKGWTCIDGGCRQACDLSASGCPNGGFCTPSGNQYGYCPP